MNGPEQVWLRPASADGRLDLRGDKPPTVLLCWGLFALDADAAAIAPMASPVLAVRP